MKNAVATALAVSLAAGLLLAAAPARAEAPPQPWPPAVLAKTPWPIVGGNLEHNGRSPYAGPTKPTVRWKMADFDRHFGIAMRSITIGTDGTLYVAAGMAGMYAIDPRQQKVKWILRTDGQTSGQGPLKDPWVEDAATVAADGTLYVASQNGYLYALQDGGQVKWKFAETYHLHSVPTPYLDGSILMPSEDACLYDVAPDGKLRWRFQFFGRPLGAAVKGSLPTCDREGRIFFTGNGCLWAVSPKGRQLWADKSGDSEAAGPAAGRDGTLYWTTREGGLVMATSPDGRRKWSMRIPLVFERNPALGADDTLYIGSGDGNLYAVTAQGKVKWKFPVGGSRLYGGAKSDALVDAAGIIYIYAYDGTLYALADRGDRAEEKWRYNVGFEDTGQPGIGLALDADGTLYLGTSSSQGGPFVLVALQGGP